MMNIRNHIENYLRQLFARALKEKPADFLSAMVPIDTERFEGHGIIPLGFKDEMAELHEFIQQYCGLEPVFEHRLRELSRNRLLTYTHILEADFIYLVLLNLMLVLLAKQPFWTFYRFDSAGNLKLNSKGEKIACAKPIVRINILKELGEQLELKVHEVFSALWKNELRNAFSHSQYFIEENGGVILTKHLIHDFKVRQWNSDFMLIDSKTVRELNENAIMLFEKFILVYQEYAYPYQTSGTHTVRGYPVMWDTERKWWTFDYGR